MKEIENIYKYVDFGKELKKLGNVKVIITSIVADVLGTVPRGLEKRLGDVEISGRDCPDHSTVKIW